MADNTTLNTGSGGDVIATDDIAGVKHQRVKIQHGADGSATDVSTASPLPVSDAGGSLTVDGTVTANAGTGPFPVSDNGGSLTVDGTVTVQDGGSSLSVDDNGGSLTVDGAVSVIEPTKVVRNLFMATGTILTGTAALMSLAQWYNNAAVAATTTPAVVPVSKTLRIQAIAMTYVGIATATSARVSIVANTAGTVTTGSPIAVTVAIGQPAAAAGVAHQRDVTLPGGLDFPAGTGIGVLAVGVNATGGVAAAGYVQVSLFGYEF